jgi:hypothetical protein
VPLLSFQKNRVFDQVIETLFLVLNVFLDGFADTVGEEMNDQ